MPSGRPTAIGSRVPPTPRHSVPIARHMREVEAPAPEYVRPIEATFKPLLIPRGELAVTGLSDGELLNPSVCVHADKLVAIVRVLSHAKTYNFLGYINDAWELAASREVKNLTACKSPYGFEDCRLFSRGGALYASAAVLETHVAIVVVKFNGEGDLVEAQMQRSPGRHEKNWMPVISNGRLWFIYSTEPIVRILSYDDVRQEVSPSPSTFTSQATYLRGGSQLQPFDDGFLSVVHQVHKQPSIYLHRFVLFDRFLQVKKMSEPFYFRRKGIEFCAGLAHWRDKWVMSLGVADKEAWLALVDDTVIRKTLEG